MYDIEKDLDISLIKKSKGRPPKYPFETMEVGDSFFAEGESLPSSRAYLASSQYAMRHGLKFSGRTTERGVRIWRVK